MVTSNGSIDGASVRDFAALFRAYNPSLTKAIMDALAAMLPDVQAADNGPGEQYFAAAFHQRYPQFPQEIARGWIRELCYHVPPVREGMIIAVQTLARDAMATRAALDRCFGSVVREMQQLDNRTRAILEIRETLAAATSNIEEADYTSITDELPAADMDALRNEPGLAAIVEAYDLAVRVLEQQSDLTA